jgi:hypothetical protein
MSLLMRLADTGQFSSVFFNQRFHVYNLKAGAFKSTQDINFILYVPKLLKS